MNLSRVIPRALLLAVIAGAVLWVTLNRDQFDATSLDRWLTDLGLWAPFVHVLLFTVGTIVFLPGSLFGEVDEESLLRRA